MLHLDGIPPLPPCPTTEAALHSAMATPSKPVDSHVMLFVQVGL